MRKCVNCGAEYADDSIFCGECGGKLEEVKTETPKPVEVKPAEEPIAQEDPNEKYKYKNNIYTGDKYLLNSGAGFTDKIKPYFLGSFAIVVIIHIILAVKGYMNALNFYNKYAELEIGGFNSGATIVQVIIAGVISVVIVMAIIYAVVMAGMAIYNLKNIEKIKFYLPANVDDPKELMNTLAPKLKKYYSQKSGDELTKEKLAYKIILKPYEGCFSVIISNKGFYRTYGCYKKAINEIPNIAHTIQSELEKINPIPQSNFADKSGFYNVNTAMLAVCLVITAVVYGSINMPSFMSSGDILEDMDNLLGDYEDMDIDLEDLDEIAEEPVTEAPAATETQKSFSDMTDTEKIEYVKQFAIDGEGTAPVGTVFENVFENVEWSYDAEKQMVKAEGDYECNYTDPDSNFIEYEWDMFIDVYYFDETGLKMITDEYGNAVDDETMDSMVYFANINYLYGFTFSDTYNSIIMGKYDYEVNSAKFVEDSEIYGYNEGMRILFWKTMYIYNAMRDNCMFYSDGWAIDSNCYWDDYDEFIDDLYSCFTDELADKLIEDKVYVSDDKIWFGGGIGHMGFQGVDIKPVSSTENEAVFQGVAEFRDEENDYYDTQVFNFKAIKQNGKWKFSEWDWLA